MEFSQRKGNVGMDKVNGLNFGQKCRFSEGKISFFGVLSSDFTIFPAIGGFTV